MVGDKPPWTQKTLLSIRADKLHTHNLCLATVISTDAHYKAMNEHEQHEFQRMVFEALPITSWLCRQL